MKVLIFTSCLFCFFLPLAKANNCIAHRGDNQHFLENSLESLKGAMDLNAHGVEFDLQHSVDEVAIVMHDSTLERTAMSAPGRVCPLKEKINKLKIATILENCLLNNGSRIPTLEEALDLLDEFSGHVFIEFKDEPSHPTLSLIAQKRTGKEDKTRFISFKRKYLKKAYKLKNKYPLYGQIKLLNINVFWPVAGRNLGLDVGKWGKGFLFWARWWKKEIGIWTVDKVSTMRKLFEKKVPFITTNNISDCMTLSEEYR